MRLFHIWRQVFLNCRGWESWLRECGKLILRGNKTWIFKLKTFSTVLWKTMIIRLGCLDCRDQLSFSDCFWNWNWNLTTAKTRLGCLHCQDPSKSRLLNTSRQAFLIESHDWKLRLQGIEGTGYISWWSTILNRSNKLEPFVILSLS
jgi:hypothetical protein